MTLPTMKEKDRVRITVEGELLQIDCHLYTVLLDGGGDTDFTLSELTSPTARVEVLPPPIDPDLVLAREWFKTRYPTRYSDADAGGYDNHAELSAYLAGLKAAKAGGRV